MTGTEYVERLISDLRGSIKIRKTIPDVKTHVQLKANDIHLPIENFATALIA